LVYAAERLFVIVVMYIGSLIFGILLAEVQQVVHQASQVLVKCNYAAHAQ
jgi:hypothetical protein